MNPKDEDFPGRSPSEISEEWKRELAQLSKDIFIEDRCVVFGFHDRYFIELKRVNSSAKLLTWVRHLVTKPWMTPVRVKFFIDLVASQYPKMKIRRSL